MHYSSAIKMFLLCCLLASCVKDKGNYDYTPINDIAIAGIDSVYFANYGKQLTIRPELSFTIDGKEDTAHYTYQWVADHLLGYTMAPRVVANTRDLDTSIRLAYGNYYMYYRVTDKRTGYFKDAYFVMNVSAPSYEGWMLLCDIGDGNSRLDMIARRGTGDSVYRDVLKEVNSAFTATGTPSFITCTYTGIAPSNGSMGVMIATSEKAAGLGIDSFNYSSTFNLNNSISGGYQVADFTGARAYPRIYGGLMWAENNLLNFGFSSFTGPVNRQDNNTALFRAAPFAAVAPLSSNAIVFNNDNKTFLRHAGSTNCLTLPAGTLFDFTTGKELVYMTYVGYNGGEVFAILKDAAAGKYYLARFTNTGVQRYYAELNVADIASARNFAVSPMLGYLFYSVGSKVYEYDFTSGKSIMMKDYGNRKISLMQFHYFSSTYSTTLQNYNFYSQLGQQLAVCTYEESDLKTSGMLELYRVPDINGQIQLSRSYSGVGKVASLNYRER